MNNFKTFYSPDGTCIVFIVSVFVWVGAEVCRGLGRVEISRSEWEDGSSPKLAEGPALVIVV